MIVYISGPITGMPGGNRDAFSKMTVRLIDRGHHAINPHHLGETLRYLHAQQHRPEPTWDDYMDACLPALRQAQAVVLLPGYERSRGCRIELAEAHARGLRVFEPGQEVV